MPMISDRLDKILYGMLFVIVLPAFLVAWAILSEPKVPLPVVGSPEFGLLVVLCGGTIMAAGVLALMIYGQGLPMSPFPPKYFVAKGIYRYIRHPIYVGFSILCIGVSIAAHSASGLWLVSPIVILGCVALVFGYEKHDLAGRFDSFRSSPLLSIPAQNDEPAGTWDRLSVYLLVLLPWVILYEAVKALGVPNDAFSLSFSFEATLPVWEWTEAIYVSTYLFVFLAPLVARSKNDLHQFSVSGLISTFVILLLFLSIPVVAVPRPFESHSFLGNLLLFERSKDTPAAAFPSFHVLWALLAAQVYRRRWPSTKLLWWGWAVLISASCITTGMHTIGDVITALLVFFFANRISDVWKHIRSFSERVANSWKEWQIGSIRIINHGAFAGVGTFIGLTIAGSLVGPEHIASVLIVAFSGLIISALWAQFIEGSPKLLRPYGYYGGVVGVIIGAIIASALGTSVWLMLGSFCIAGPWIQSFGRLRCLTQGCCHGRETSLLVGIRYNHPRSRVCRLAGLTGVPLHPTPVYSILWNVVIAFVVTRLWFLGSSLVLIAGMYLILTGLGRFVEEALRGEPQTPIVGGLRLYQWIAILSVVVGAVSTSLPSMGEAQPPQLSWLAPITGFGFGVFTWIALGVDFPNSNKRFTRLV